MNSNEIKILVVDEQPNNLRFLSNILTEQGYEVQRAMSGQLALEAAFAHPPDLILLDIQMPEMNGYEVCKQLKASDKTRDIPVIFLSALNQGSDTAKAFEVGGADYIVKPFQVPEVLARIANQLAIRKLSGQLKEQNAQLQQEISVREASRKACIKAESLLAGVLNSCLDGMMAFKSVRDSQGTIVDFEWLLVNPAAEKMFGRTSDDLVGKYLLSEMRGNREAGLFDLYVRVVETGEALENESYYEHEGIKAWFQKVAVKLDDGFAVTFRNITESKLAQETLKQQKELLQTIFDRIPVMVCFYDCRGQIQFCNREVESILGWSIAELRKCDFLSECYPDPEYRQTVLDFMQAATGKWQDFKTRTRSGQILDTCWANIRLSDGTTIGIGQDISDRKQAEEALRESEARFRGIFESAAIAIGLTTADGKPIEANRTFEAFLGYSEAEMCDPNFPNVTHPEDRAADMALTQEVIDGVRDSFQIEKRYIHKDGHIFWGRATVSAVRNQQGEFQFTVGMLEDINERKLQEIALRESERRFRAIFNNSFQFTGLLQPDGKVIEVNQTALDFVAIEHSEVAGVPFWETGWWTEDAGEEDTGNGEKHSASSKRLNPKQERLRKAIEEAASGKFVRYEVEITGFKGIVATIDFSIKPVLDETGLVVLLIPEGRDISGRKKAEERLRLLERAIAASSNGIMISDLQQPDNPVIYANSGFERITGYSVEEVIGKNCRFLHGNDTEQAALEELRRAITEGREAQVVVRNYRKDGKLFWNEFCITPVRDAQGRLTNFVGVQTDITKRKQAEIELENAKAALERQIRRALLLNQITQEIRSSLKPEQIFQTAATQIGKALRVNRCLIHTYIERPTPQIPFVAEYKEPGIESALDVEILVMGNPHAQLLLTQDRAIASDDVYADPLLADTSSQCLLLGLKSMLCVRTSYQGKPNGLIAIHQYDSCRQWTQEEIELLESVAAQMGIAIAGANLLEQETQRRRELAAQNHALEKAKLAAEAANRAKSQFLSKMSHELRTPLNAILGFTQVMARDDSLTKEHKEQLGIINRSGEHLLELINDILSMSKIEAGGVRLNQNRFNLYRLLNSVEEMLGFKAASKGLQFIIERSPDLPQYVQTDESKLRQVLINLLGNAIKFTQTGRVTLRVSVDVGAKHSGDKSGLAPTNPQPNASPVQLSVVGAGLQISELGLEDADQPARTKNNGQGTTDNRQLTIHFDVEDTGPGIAPEELGTLFEPFVQTQTGRSSMEGTGLGLAISRQFVRLMGGEITVSSELGRGSIFTFDIQVGLATAADEQTIASRRRVIGLQPNQPRYRILVVEDVPENRQLLVKLLAYLGFEVREAANGQEGVALWESWSPHLIWMDIFMPVMDGYEATKQIKARENLRAEGAGGAGGAGGAEGEDLHREFREMVHFECLAANSSPASPAPPAPNSSPAPHARTIIIALSASAFEEQREAMSNAGCDDFLSKPFREEELLEKMAQHLGVRYIYEEEKQPTSPESVIQPRLTTDNLKLMPCEWVAQLHQAALSIDDQLIMELLEQIPETEATLKSALTDLVDNFRIDKIIELTQCYGE